MHDGVFFINFRRFGTIVSCQTMTYFSDSLPIIICMCLFLVLTFTVFVAAQDLLGISQLALLLQIAFFYGNMLANHYIFLSYLLKS